MPNPILRVQTGLNLRKRSHVQHMIAEIRSLYGDTNKAKRAADCAIATALVESNVTVYANGYNPESLRRPHEAVGWDHGSVGIYQQQVGGAPHSTADWGTTLACMDINWSTKSFVTRLVKLNWDEHTNGELCQMVQGSAFPDRYAQRDAQAIKIRKILWNTKVSRGVA